MHNALLAAVEEYLQPPQTIVLRGAPEAMATWTALCTRRYAPHRPTLAILDGARDLPGILAQRTPRGGAPPTSALAMPARLPSPRLRDSRPAFRMLSDAIPDIVFSKSQA